MGKTDDFLKQEKECYGKIYFDISYAINDISPFVDDKELRTRKYVSKLPVLKKYIELLEAAESEVKKGGFLTFLRNDKYIDLLKSYKRDNSESLEQLKKCSCCSCLKCTNECCFDKCLGCRSSSLIKSCDHKDINVTIHDNFMLNLTNNNTGEQDRYKVLAVLQSITNNQKYIIIENISTDEKFILYYYPGISEDTYGEITDPEEFDFVASTYQSIEE